MEIPAAHPRRSILSIQVLRHLNLGNCDWVTTKIPEEKMAERNARIEDSARKSKEPLAGWKASAANLQMPQ
jgi:hypothetical protein